MSYAKAIKSDRDTGWDAVYGTLDEALMVADYLTELGDEVGSWIRKSIADCMGSPDSPRPICASIYRSGWGGCFYLTEAKELIASIDNVTYEIATTAELYQDLVEHGALYDRR